MVCRYMNTDELTEAGLTPTEIETVLRRRKLRELHEAGLTPREIAVALTVTTAHVYQQLQKWGIKPNRKAVS
jgi:hypothetical protein